MNKKYNELVELGRYLFERQYVSGSSGNLSLRYDDNHILLTPSLSKLGKLDKENLSLVSIDGQHVKGGKPTKEMKFHLEIYRKRNNCNAVIHLHSTYLTAMSCLADIADKTSVFKAFTPYVVMRVGKVPLIPYFHPGSDEIAESISAVVINHSAFLLANHGIIASGNSVDDACGNFEELEETAKLYFILKSHNINYLTDEQLKKLEKLKI
ncbi:MAG: aldolase [Spirochaeta sp. LUC14_002_19_P3]|nr:MAG: aldolase [Spirochaeta sp. LUC14_002_19_P3]